MANQQEPGQKKQGSNGNATQSNISWLGFNRNNLSDQWKNAVNKFLGAGGGAEQVKRHLHFSRQDRLADERLTEARYIVNGHDTVSVLHAAIAIEATDLLCPARETAIRYTSPASIAETRTM